MSTQKTGFFWHEKCFWHGAGNYAFLLPVGGLVEPTSSGFLPEAPEAKRRMKNLLEVTGLLEVLDSQSPHALATEAQLRLVHPKQYLDAFKSLSDGAGGNLGLRTPFGPGGFEIASLSCGLVISALFSVLDGQHKNAYALSRPPGHHCLPDYPNGFCLLNNIAVAVEAARQAGKAERFAIVDWDVHHGNGTEHIFYADKDVLTISIHQERNYPLDSGDAGDTGADTAPLSNMNIPLMPGGGRIAYKDAFERLVLPKLQAFKPDIVIVACGFDASGVDPLSRMLLGAADFAVLTKMLMEQTGGKLVMAHEGGYSDAHSPFCGHAVLQEMSAATITAEDPLGARITGQQPGDRFNQLQRDILTDIARLHQLA